MMCCDSFLLIGLQYSTIVQPLAIIRVLPVLVFPYTHVSHFPLNIIQLCHVNFEWPCKNLNKAVRSCAKMRAQCNPRTINVMPISTCHR